MKQSISSLLVVAAALFYGYESQAGLTEDFAADPPLYCADPTKAADFTKTRAIPKLDAKITAHTDKQRQVLVMTRYGSRTTSRARNCWLDYKPEWNCKSGETIRGWVTPKAAAAAGSQLPSFPFRKQYDARPSANKLKNSACEVGQLVPTGYKQHDLLGKVLAEAYFKQATANQNLFDLKGMLERNETLDNMFYFRSTNTQRTKMSGVQLVSSLVKAVHPTENDPQITLHTAEFGADSLRFTPETCYDLELIMKEAYTSQVYTDTFFPKNKVAKELAAKMMGIDAIADGGKGAWPWHVQDCLGVALCSGHPLPETEDWTKENVELILNKANEEFEWLYHFHNASYSKVATVMFAYDIKASLVKRLCRRTLTIDCVKQFTDKIKEITEMVDYLKTDAHIPDHPLIYWSGHETTIGQFLATFGIDFVKSIAEKHPGEAEFIGFQASFPNYASILAIELFEREKGPMFRFIYNGRVITEHVKGCEKGEELCSIKMLFNALSWATRAWATFPCLLSKPKEYPEE